MTQAFNLSQLANNLNSSGQLDATDGLVNAVPLANGGTGASGASAARTNLGLVIGTDVPSPSGSGASGTWAINVSGNAATATSAGSATTAGTCTGNSATATTASSCSGNSATATALSSTSGSAPSYSVRAWVNFNGAGTVGTNLAIRASGNIASVYKNAVGDYTITFTTAMPDANYVVHIGIGDTQAITSQQINYNTSGTEIPPTTTSFTISTGQPGNGPRDPKYVHLMILR